MTQKFIELVPSMARKYGGREALRYRDYATQEWTSMSWNDMDTAVGRVAVSLYKAGVEEQGRVCIFSQNCPEILITHFAAFSNRAVPVPIYATSSKDEAAYIVNDAGATVLFTGDQNQYAIARQLLGLCPTLKHIVTLDPSVVRDADDADTMSWAEFMAQGGNPTQAELDAVEARRKAFDPADLMYLIYTSGTTGVPKGVMLTHHNFMSAMDGHLKRIHLNDETDLSLSFLPFSHVFELGWTMVCLCSGVRVAINLNPKEIQKAVREVQPTCMCSVPRFWEKVYTAINDNVSKAKPVVKMLFKRAVAVGRTRNVKYVRTGRKPPLLVEKQYQYFEKKVFSRLRRAIGVEHGRFFPTAGAMLSDNITEFLHAIGLNIVIGYGLSETNATVSFYPSVGWELGTIGTTLPGVMVKIGDDNEILVKGPTVMKGYFHKPEETAKAIDADGWFHTGDCGHITDTGQLVMTERLKDLYKTSNGKYIAPQVLETALAQDIFVEQVTVIGDGRKYVSALIVPNFDELKAYAAKKKIDYKGIDDLVNNADIHKMLDARIQGYQKDMASYEQIKRFVLLPRPFTMESGELTNTLKIRRAVISKRYAKLIDAMYAADFRKKGDNQDSNK